MKTVIDSKDDRFLIDTIEKEATVYFSVGNTYLNDLAVTFINKLRLLKNQ